MNEHFNPSRIEFQLCRLTGMRRDPGYGMMTRVTTIKLADLAPTNSRGVDVDQIGRQSLRLHERDSLFLCGAIEMRRSVRVGARAAELALLDTELLISVRGGIFNYCLMLNPEFDGVKNILRRRRFLQFCPCASHRGIPSEAQIVPAA